MLIDVVELNDHGVRIPREHRRGLPCVRGRISVEHLLSHQNFGNALVHAHIVPPCLEPLYGVKLRYWRAWQKRDISAKILCEKRPCDATTG